MINLSMKPTSVFLILLSFFLTGCELTNFDFKGNLTDGFCLISGDEVVLNHIKTIQPQPWNSWKSDWLTLIRGNETKTITITYNDFDAVPPGNYKATFVYPGLAYQVKKDEIDREDGRIWLGSIETVKDVVIE